jgi:hypothetical protein
VAACCTCAFVATTDVCLGACQKRHLQMSPVPAAARRAQTFPRMHAWSTARRNTLDGFEAVDGQPTTARCRCFIYRFVRPTSARTILTLRRRSNQASRRSRRSRRCCGEFRSFPNRDACNISRLSLLSSNYRQDLGSRNVRPLLKRLHARLADSVRPFAAGLLSLLTVAGIRIQPYHLPQVVWSSWVLCPTYLLSSSLSWFRHVGSPLRKSAKPAAGGWFGGL